MYDRILLPTDGSDAGAAATEHAYSHAERYDAELHVLHVLAETERAAIVGRGDEYEEAIDDDARTALNDLSAEAIDRGIDVTEAVEVGTPYRSILAYAEDNDVDLIVMSTHGRSGVGRIVMGSVTERVVRVGDVPVLAVKRT